MGNHCGSINDGPMRVFSGIVVTETSQMNRQDGLVRWVTRLLALTR